MHKLGTLLFPKFSTYPFASPIHANNLKSTRTRRGHRNITVSVPCSQTHVFLGIELARRCRVRLGVVGRIEGALLQRRDSTHVRHNRALGNLQVSEDCNIGDVSGFRSPINICSACFSRHPARHCAASVRAFICMATQSPFEYINTSDAQIMKTESHNLARKASRRTRAPPQTNSHSKRRAQALATCPPDLRSCIKVPRECLCPTSACITSLDMPDHATARSANWHLATSTPGSAAPNRRMLHTSITAVA